jgi:3-hydroxybutyryl-CoA dehydrogenase
MLTKTTVIGAGLMGGQIAVVLAVGSRETFLMSRRRETIERALTNIPRYTNELYNNGILRSPPEEVFGRIHATTSLEEAAEDAELVVEAVTEDLDVKRDVFKRLDKVARPEAILASNTSGLPISRIAEATERPERVVGSHFIQPAHIVPLVEVVKGAKTSEDTVLRAADIWRGLGKVPIIVKNDLPGFIVNRMQHALVREAVFLLAKGVAEAKDIDLAVTLGLGPRFTVSGPLEQRDLNGIDVNYMVARHLWSQLSGWEEPLNYLKGKVDKGELGLKVGKGYYDWSGSDPTEVRRIRDEALIKRTKEALIWMRRLGRLG